MLYNTKDIGEGNKPIERHLVTESTMTHEGFEEHPHVKEMLEADAVGKAPDDPEMIMQKIVHVLTIYPRLSPSMLQIGVGTGLKPSIWKPILERLITNGVVIRTFIQAETPSDRVQSYAILSLPINSPTINAVRDETPSIAPA